MEKLSFSYYVTEYREMFGENLTVEQAAFISGIDLSIIKRMISYDLIEMIDDGNELKIPVSGIPKLKRIVRLHYDLGIGWNSMAIVLDLLNRIEELENR